VIVGWRRVQSQEAKYIESWPSTTSAWAGWSRFDIPVDRYGGVHPCYYAPAIYWGLLPATGLASRIILIERNIKKRTGPALCVLCCSECPALARNLAAVCCEKLYDASVYFPLVPSPPTLTHSTYTLRNLCILSPQNRKRSLEENVVARCPKNLFWGESEQRP
jgi:hypothetical protein